MPGPKATDFKSVSRVLTSFHYALPSSIYRRFSRQSKLRPAWYKHVTPSSSPHVAQVHKPLIPRRPHVNQANAMLDENFLGRRERQAMQASLLRQNVGLPG